MKSLFTNRAVTALIVAGSALVAGCTTTNNLYGWNGYQPEVYEYFKGEAIEEQITTLEKSLEEIKAKGKLVPPGFHAHLGMLYAQVGDLGKASEQFNTEKRLFPESAPYMDFLLKKKDFSKTVAANEK